MSRALSVLLVLLAVGFAGCGSKSTAGDVCTPETAACDDGQVCYRGECKPVECTTSAECEINNYCAKTYTCEAGCGSDDDCQAGQSCDSEHHACRDYGCRDTQLDCSPGEFCNASTGECSQPDADLCRTCNPNNPTSCGGGAWCVQWLGEEGGYCYPAIPGNDPDLCPRGFTPYDLGAGYGYMCAGDCAFLKENGYL